MAEEREIAPAEEAITFAPDAPGADLGDLLEKLGLLPEKSVVDLLKRVAADRPTEATGLLERLGIEAKGSIGGLAAQTLGTIRDERAADSLQRIALAAPSGEARKAARRELHRLASLGIVPSPVQPEVSRIRETPAKREAVAFTSPIDGAGNRGIWFALPEGFEVEAISLLVNDESGIRDAVSWETSRGKYQREVDKLLADPEMPWVEMPADYARYLLDEAHAVNARIRSALPFDYLAWRDRIGRPSASYDRPLVYGVINGAEVRWNPQFLDGAGGLLDSQLFQGWFLDKDDLAEFVRELMAGQQAGLVLSSGSQRDREHLVVDRAIQKLFDARRRELYKRRLEETSYQLWKLDRGLPAKIALAAALALEPTNASLQHHPFIRGLVERSLEVAMALSEGERRKPISPGIELHLPY